MQRLLNTPCMGPIPTGGHRNLLFARAPALKSLCQKRFGRRGAGRGGGRTSLYQSSNFRITQPFQASPNFHAQKRGCCLRGPHPKTRRNSKASSLSLQTVGSHCEGLAPCLRAQGVLKGPPKRGGP